MSALDRWYDVRDRVAGWWNTAAAAAGSERIRKQSTRYDSGRCMYDHPNGRPCFGRQMFDTPFCEAHQSEYQPLDDDGDGWHEDHWDDEWDRW